MPIFVTTDQGNVAELAAAVLRPRASRVLRERAIEAIRAANPTLDLDDLRPGTIVSIPALEGGRTTIEDPVAAPVDGLVAQAESGLDGLLAAAEQALAFADEERTVAQRILSSAEIRRLAEGRPELADAIGAWQQTAKEDRASHKEQLASLHSGAARWSEELAQLRALMAD